MLFYTCIYAVIVLGMTGFLNILQMKLKISFPSCEVIKDHKTKESLQYAFIEFEKVGIQKDFLIMSTCNGSRVKMKSSQSDKRVKF